MTARGVTLVVAFALCCSPALVACTSDSGTADGASTPREVSPAPEPTRRTDSNGSGPGSQPASSPDNAGSPSDTSPSSPDPQPERSVRFDQARALRTVTVLAHRYGPREATSAAYAAAARYVERSLRGSGYDVRRQSFQVPAGNSWGVDVPAGRTWNVVATPVGFDGSRPFRIVGAHLDTVPHAPGAEDNASGVAVMLELARLGALDPLRTPVVFVAFGAEEPRGDGDDLHHFGSQVMVQRLVPQWRRSLEAMLSLDRVGVGRVVPVCSGGLEPPTVRAALIRTADTLSIAAAPCLNQSSDHWSFDQAGFPAARIGSTPYAEYHSEADRPRVVSPAQLRRVGQVAWAWLS